MKNKRLSLLMLIIALFPFSCSEGNRIELSTKGKVYMIQYSNKWKANYYAEVNDQKEYVPPYIELNKIDKNGKFNGAGKIEIYTEETKNCPPEDTQSANSSDEDEEGPEFTPNYKKDKITINNQLLDRWYNKKNMSILKVFMKQGDNQCFLFMMSYYDSEYEENTKEFYQIIKSFH